MRSRAILVGLYVLFVCSVSARSASGASVSNGSFEAGLSSWLATDLTNPLDPVASLSGGAITAFDGFLGPNVVLPSEGSRALNHGFDGDAGVIVLAQDVGIVGAGEVLSFDYRAGWDLITFTPPGALDREFRVEIQPAGGGIPLGSFPILSVPAGTDTAGGPNSDIGPQVGLIDLTPFSGLDVRVVFLWEVPESQTGPANFQLDDVRILMPSEVPSASAGTLVTLCVVMVGIGARWASPRHRS